MQLYNKYDIFWSAVQLKILISQATRDHSGDELCVE